MEQDSSSPVHVLVIDDSETIRRTAQALSDRSRVEALLSHPDFLCIEDAE